MYNSKSENGKDKAGSISYILGERKYFGPTVNNIFDGKWGYYSNVYNSIFGKLK
ncbi:hypothetical protein [Fonticella tunisiensis]|uniref:Uncharacterized protein n=1 Tax=Fonticella tunisiensis TaxID=1096341 RepID=A0A4R7KTN6_9CLOT|nr:hypothetical protein [Fonticella tunisiensis]TDT61523.1 hypothetical protein EDD71_1067 [Fonticella tunisiensis]